MLTFSEVSSQSAWDMFLLAHAPQALFQSWQWGEVEKRLGTDVWRYAIYDKKKMVGVAQVTFVKAKRGKFLHVRHGPVFSEQKQSYWRDSTSFLRMLARTHGAWFVRVSPLVHQAEVKRITFRSLKYLPAPIHAMNAEYCWVLDLKGSEEDILAAMRKTTRYEIRRAEKLDVWVKRSVHASDLAVFDRLYEQTFARHGFIGHKGIHEEFEVFSRDDKVLLLTAGIGPETTASAIILFYGNQAIYHHGASLSSKIPASYAIQWTAIREAKKRGMDVYNFWGIARESDKNHPWRGITLFKKGFGGREIEYIHAQDLPVTPWYWFSWCIDMIRKIKKGY